MFLSMHHIFLPSQDQLLFRLCDKAWISCKRMESAWLLVSPPSSFSKISSSSSGSGEFCIISSISSITCKKNSRSNQLKVMAGFSVPEKEMLLWKPYSWKTQIPNWAINHAQQMEGLFSPISKNTVRDTLKPYFRCPKPECDFFKRNIKVPVLSQHPLHSEILRRKVKLH